MPDAAVRLARGVSEVRTPQHLVPLRTQVRQELGTELAAVHTTLSERLNRTSEDYLNVFRAAAEMAVMEQAGRETLPLTDRRVLRPALGRLAGGNVAGGACWSSALV